MKLEIFKSSFGYYNLRTVDGYPTDEMTEYLKSNGYRWSRNNNCWYPATAEAKEANLHDDFVVNFQEKFFPPVSESQEPKSFGQELFEREQRKTEWRESHGLSTKYEHSVEKVSDDERITYLENLIKELQEERQKDKEKIAHLEFELANNRDEGMTEFYSQQEQQQIDEESEWEKENTLTDEEEQEIINNVVPETSIVNNADVMNKLGEILEAVAREEEPEAEKEFSESQEKEDVEVEVSPEELSRAKSVLPTSQYVTTLRLSQGEEGNFFKQKIKDIAEVVKNAPKIYETNGAEQHPIVLRYFHPTGTETLVTEIGEDGEAFGYQCLNGDYEMAEFGYIDLNEVKSIRMMEIDYHVEKGMTVERWLYKEQPEMFPQYAKFAERSEEKNPLNIAKETGNDVNAISDSPDKSKKRYYYNPYSQEYFTIAFEDNDWHYVFYDKDYNVLSDDVGITPDSPNNITEAIDTILEMRYNIDGFDPDGMSTSEYESARAEKEHYLSKNWTIWTDEQGFENILEEKRKVEEENEKKISVLKDILKNDEELKQSALVNNRQDFENAYYDKLSEILIKQYNNDKSDFTRNLLNSDVSKKEIMGEYIDEIYNGFISDKNEKVINAENNAYPYNFFINDVANLDLGIGAEIEPITGLTAEQAVLKYAELKEKGYAIYIGLNIPGDFVFDDKEGQGAEIFGQVNGRPSFYMGDNFVKELKEYDSHARTVIAAYKELYEMADKYILGVERPDFVYEKDNELWAKYLDEDSKEQLGFTGNEGLFENESEAEYKSETEAEYKIMQEISKGLTPDEIKLNLEKYRESLVYAQEKSNETWDDFYSRNTTGFDAPQTIEEFRKAYEGNKKQFEYDVKKYTGWIKALEEKQSINVSDEEIAQEKVLIQNKINQLKEELNNPDNQKGGMNYDENAEKELLEHIQRFENISDEEIKKQIIWKKENQKNNEATAKNVDNYITELAQNRAVPQDGELLSFNETHPLITVTNKQTGRQTSIRPFGDLAETVKNMARLKTISEANNVIENIKISGFEIASTTSRIIVYDNDKFFDFDYFAGAVGKLDKRNLNDWDFKTFVDNDLKITKKMKESLQIENPVNAKLKENINWSEYTEEAFTKTKADLHNWVDGEVYASINVGQLSFELVPQNYGDRMELDTRIYYPKLYATYGEDTDGVKYDTASGFDIDAETFAKMSYEEFKDYFANTVLPSSLDKDLIERALQPTEDWNTIWEKLNKENNFSYMFPEGLFKNSKELDKYEVEYEGTFDFGETDGICQVVSGDKKTLEKIAADYGYELHPDYLYHKDDLDLDDRTSVHDMAFRSVDLADSFKSENVEVIKEPETQQLTSKKDIKAIREQCREILEKLDNSYLKDNEMSYLENELGEKRDEDKKQVEASLRSMKYIYSATKDSEGYWNTSGKEITANEARKMLSMSDFVSAVDRASFHYTSGRVVKDNNDKEIGYIHFDDSDRNRIVPPYELTKEDLSILAQYEGAGGLNEINRTNAGILNEFYTPNYLVEKVWQIVDAYAPNAKTVLEPSAGVGKFANNRPNNEFTMHELDETSARINKILHPEANIVQGAYQKQFFDEGERFINKNFVQPKYDVVIGNPPYGKYNDKYKGLGEGKEFDRYEEYFIAKGLDALKDENSLLALVVPSGFLNTTWDKSKSLISEKGEIIDAYRLPEGTFPTTEVGTDIIIMRSWSNYEHAFEKEYGKDLFMSIENHKRDNSKMLAWGEWFKAHPEKILGEVKTRTNRFGKEEEYVTVHEGFTVQDELNKIDEFVKQSTPNFDKNIDKVLVDEKTNYILEKLSKAGIEVVTDKEQFDKILASQTVLQKMTDDLSEFDKLAAELEKEKNVTENIENQKQSLEEKKEELAYSNYKELVDFVNKTEKYIPAQRFGFTTHISSVENKVPLVINKEGKPVFWIANRLGNNYDNSNSTSLVIITENNASGVDAIDVTDYKSLHHYIAFNPKYEECRLLDSSLLNSYKEKLKAFLEQKISNEQQNQKRLTNDVENINTDLLNYENLRNQLKEESEKTQNLEKTKEEQEHSIRWNNYLEFANFIKAVQQYIPVEEDFDTNKNYSSDWYKVANRIPIHMSEGQATAWLVNAEISKGVVSPVIIDRSYTGVRFLNGSNSYDSIQKYFDDNHVLETFKKELRWFYEKRIAQEQKNQDNLIKDFEELKELNLTNNSNKKLQSESMTNDMKSILIDLMNKPTENFVPTVYTRENYQKIFGDGIIETPVETVKMSNNQFVRLCPADRNNLMLAIKRTLEEPSLVIEKDSFDKKTETFKPVHVYGKSFINTDSNHTKTVESVIIFREGENIAMSLHNRELKDFIKQIKTADEIIYLDKNISRVAAFNKVGDSHVVKEAQEFLSSSEQMFLPLNSKYDKNKILSSEEYIAHYNIEVGNLVITKENFDRYFNIFNRHDSYKDNLNKIASELFNYHVRAENKDSMREWLTEQGYKLSEKNKAQTMVQNGNTYGFAYEGKIYLNPDVMNSEAAIHEYTHLWDSYTQKTNPELWQKGLNIFKDTSLWEDVINDENYADIKNDENLILSECHARICGKIADEVLQKVLERDGNLKQAEMIDWDKEVDQYIYENFESSRTLSDGQVIKSTGYGAFGTVVDVNAIRSWFSAPMKDLFQRELNLKLEQQQDSNRHVSFENETLDSNNKLLRTPKSYPYINNDGSLNPDRLNEGDIIIDKEDNTPYESNMIFGNDFLRLTSISMKKESSSLFEEFDEKSRNDEQSYELGMGWKNVLNERFSAPTKEQLETWKYPSWYQHHLDEQEEYESERDYIRQPVLKVLEESKNGKSFEKEELIHVYAETLAKELDFICHHNDVSFEERINPATNEKTTFLTDEYGYARIDHEIPEICDFYGADLVKAVIYNSVIHFSEENENDTYLRLQKEYPEFFNEDTKNLSILDFVKNVSCTKEFAGHKVHGNSVWDLTREYINNVRDNSIDENHRLVNVIEKNGIQITVSSKRTVLKESAQDQHSLNPSDTNEQITEEVVKTKTARPKKDKWNIQKSKGEVMTAQEFSRLYGRDFDEREFPIWAATDWQGNIDLSKLNADDLQYMEQSGNYICKKLSSGEPEWTHKVLFTTGDIYAKIEEQKKFLSEAENNPVLVEMYNKNIELLEASKKNKLNMEHIHFGLKSTLAEEFIIPQYDGDGNFVNLNLQESFILWAQGHTLASRRYRNEIDFATANISREELGEELSFYDIIDYIDGKPVKADAVRGWHTYKMTEEEKKAEKAERKKEADLKRQARADVANKLFDRYLHEGLELETIKQLEEEYNRRFNSYIIPDYSKLPLFVDGMSAYKGDSKFKLYNQQIKGISFLCNKGNGLLAYDVGVGKTAAGIVTTVNQIQTERSKRPLIIVPNQVYSKWYTDIKQLFPNVKVNDLYNFNKESVGKYIDPENPHKLNIPENSISLCTYEALKNITFTDESCENELYQDFANLLSADMDGSDRENAESSDKIKGIIGSASHVKDESYYFFEECGFDNLTVDEAHNFKNLWVVPRPKKKGQSNEYAGIPSGKPSARALKMYGMTQLVQQHNDNRNVFMLTATPFTNSPTEVYSMLSYIGRERLHRAGIKSLRSFFDQFAQTKQELGVTSKGEIDTKQVMKNWKELPALQSILTEFIDKVDGEEALIIRPHKFTHVKPLDMSELQLEMREMDEARMAEVKEGNSAAVIVAMNNMRLSCVAPALANPEMYEGLELPPLSQLVETSPKLKFVCDAIIDMYKDNPEKGQFMYVPLGKDSHGIIKDYLVQHGIPKEAVEIINGEINNTPEKKEKITGKFNDVKDKLKIIIGGRNTAEGIDLNGNSFVMYNCSLGWNPSETIQAEGRIWRQNNMQGHVHIVYPVMNDSIDSVLYQKHDEKISRIDELWSYKGDSLNVEDINPEDLKLDLIKDPNKKAKLILEEETKDVKAELSKLNLKIKDFDEIIEKRKQLTLDFGTTEEDVQRYEKQIQDYKDRNLEVPEWIKLTLKNYKKDLEKQQYQKNNIQNKLYSWNLKTEEDEAAYIHNLNEQKKACEEKIHNIEKSLPEILQKLVVERMEQKIMEYPVTKQREILEADILNNLRPMKEVEFEIKTDRHNKMLAEMLKAGDITQEEHDLYKAAGYEKYEKWLNGEIESLEEKPVQEVVENDNQQGRVVEDKASKVTDEYGFEVFGEEASDKQEEIKKAVEAIPSELNDSEKMEKLKSATENAKKIVGANTISNDPSDLFFGFTDDDLFVKSPDNDKDELVVKSPEQLYFNFDNDDSYLTPDQLSKAEQERDKIVLPVLNDKESGMYKAFKDFSQHGIFDIVGTKIDMKETANGTRISPTGWKQLHAAMNIYRNKQFETFRYVLVDRHNGRIKDQLSVCSYMPNVCKVSDSEGKTLENVLTRAEETDCLIVAVHNHPSGNVQESNYDREATKSLEKSCLRNDGLQRFAGHIILDHDNFNIYKPRQGWKVYEDKNSIGIEDELINKDFAYTDTKIHTTSQLLNVAKNINETNNWNDNFIPVLFVNSDSNVSGLKYYDKSFFNKENQSIRNELQFSAIDAGAVYLFPVVTEALTNKLNGSDRFLMEERMKELVMQGILTDVVLTDSTVVEKNNLPDRRSLYEDFIKLAKTDIKSTWEHKINPTLFEQMKMGTLKIIQNEEPEKETQKDLSHLKKAAGMGY